MLISSAGLCVPDQHCFIPSNHGSSKLDSNQIWWCKFFEIRNFYSYFSKEKIAVAMQKKSWWMQKLCSEIVFKKRKNFFKEKIVFWNRVCVFKEKRLCSEIVFKPSFQTNNLFHVFDKFFQRIVLKQNMFDVCF